MKSCRRHNVIVDRLGLPDLRRYILQLEPGNVQAQVSVSRVCLQYLADGLELTTPTNQDVETRWKRQ